MAGEPPTPADRIRAAMGKRGWSETELAWALGYSLFAIQRVLGGGKITPELALRLEAALGETAESWLDVQRDLARLREPMGGELARIRRRTAAPISPETRKEPPPSGQ